MVFDTDVLIWFLRGNLKAAAGIESAPKRDVSVVSYMELVQGARDKRELIAIKGFLHDFSFEVLPLSENIGHRASIYMEQYGLSMAMSMADALVGATVIEMGRPLLTGNQKHYRCLKELDLHPFRP